MSDILDKNLAIEQAGGDETLAKELFGMLLKDAPQLLEQIEIAFNIRNTVDLWEHAHKLYGSTAYCGVPQLRERAKAVEDAIKADAHSDVLEDEVRALSEAVQSLCAHGTEFLSMPWK